MSAPISQGIPVGSEATKCKNTACPSTHTHNAGYYNFSLSYKDETTRSNPLPGDIIDALTTIHLNLAKGAVHKDQATYKFLVKFATAHHSHLLGLMPLAITGSDVWRYPEIREILRSAGPRPVVKVVEQVKIEKTKKTEKIEKPTKIEKPAVVIQEKPKGTVPPCRLRNAMGRAPKFAAVPSYQPKVDA